MRSWFTHSFKRQLFAVFLAVMLVLVIGGGFLTIQGFRSTIRGDYARDDIQQEKEIKEHILAVFEQVQDAVDGIASDDVLRRAMESGENVNPREVYSALYQLTQDIRDYCAVDLYLGDDRLYTTSSGAAAKSLSLEYSVLGQASENPDRII